MNTEAWADRFCGEYSSRSGIRFVGFSAVMRLHRVKKFPLRTEPVVQIVTVL